MALACCIAATSCARMSRGSETRAIAYDASSTRGLPQLERARHVVRPLEAPRVPTHPFMGPVGTASMHSDPYTTNAYTWRGPLGRDPEVRSRSMAFLGGECPTVTFDRLGRIVTVCVRLRTPTLLLLDPETLDVLASHTLPSRRTPLLDVRAITNDTSGGAYFFLDERGRAVIGTAAGTIELVATVSDANGARFVREREIDLRDALRLPDGELDKITAVLPDYEGRLWFVGRYGTVGFVDRAGRVRRLRLDGEEIQNTFAITEDAAYVVSDHALYRFEAREDAPRIVWRETYDRGTGRKVGQIHQGSGTTPTVLGDYVAIGDNAEPRMNVLVFRRDREPARRLVCAVPVFAPGASASENTFIGHGRSFVVENNAGYDLFTNMTGGRTSAAGVARIDVRPDESGCDVVWESDEISQTTVPKLSTATGLVYLYTKRPGTNGVDAYYFTAIDFHTGRTVFRVLAGTGMRYDNHWAAIALAPDGSAYVGLLNGLLRIADGTPPPRFARVARTRRPTPTSTPTPEVESALQVAAIRTDEVSTRFR